ncbi:MAG: phosphonate C-P lyase system protein PhnG [Candidatus Aquicultor sp.]|nr:phosphonate C-P lyase system protein PhnG [Candidatus Aquicultor sp.]
MNSATLSRVLAEGDGDFLQEVAEKVLDIAEVKVIKQPATGLVMMRARDSVEGIIFNVGEVLVTECEVELDGARGWGYMLGDEPAKALAVAVIDAAINAGHRFKDEMLRLLGEQREELERKRRVEFAMMDRTRVKFETMEAIK